MSSKAPPGNADGGTKKRKVSNTTTTSTNNNSKKVKPGRGDTNASAAGHDFALLTLEEIREKVSSLADRVPVVPPNSFYIPTPSGSSDATTSETSTHNENNGNSSSSSSINPLDVIVDEAATREWAAQLQAVLEEYNLLVCCVATATYKWGTDRSGAADQNLGLLNTELASSQDSISATVTPRLTNVLAPVVDLVIDRTVTTYRQIPATQSSSSSSEVPNSSNATSEPQPQPQYREEIKQNHFTRKLVDPDFLQLCYRILARNAPLLRRVVLSNFTKVVKAMDDYLKAQKNDTQNSSRSFAY